MTETEIKQAIFDALRQIAPEVQAEQVRPDENLREALDIDSFDFLNLLIRLHQQLDIDIPESDYGQLNTLSNLARYLSSRLAGRSAKV